MGYRFEDIKPPKPDENLPIFDVVNNEVRMWSLPCFYLDVEKPIDWHDRDFHNHIGWPQPTRPDASCQRNQFLPPPIFEYIDMDKAIPIHFFGQYEGYVDEYGIYYNYNNAFQLVWDAYDESGEAITPPNVVTEVKIREIPDDHIIDITFKPAIDQFAGEPKSFKFNLYISKWAPTDFDPSGFELMRKDLIVRGRLVVLPG